MSSVTDTTKVYYIVKWRSISLEYCFKNNAQYLEAIALAESVIVTMLRERGASIPTLKVHIAKLLDALAVPLVPTVRAIASQGSLEDKMPALTQQDLLPIWGENYGGGTGLDNYQKWFSYYHILKKFKFVGDHCGEEQIFYTEPEPEVPCERCSKDFLRDPKINWDLQPQICPPCQDYLLGDDDEEEEEEPVQKKKNQKIGMCAVCLTDTHRRCACREIYYCSAVCSKSDWKAHKKTCCYDGR